MSSKTRDIKYLINHGLLPKFNALFQQETRLESNMWNSLYMAQGHYHYQGYGTRRHTMDQMNAAKDDIDGQLKSAVLSKNTETAKSLIRQGANTSIQMDGLPLLHHLIMKNQEDILRCCIEHGADRKAVDRDGKPLLHFAVEESNINAIEVLLDYLDVNMTDSEGFTPLFYAMVSKNVEVFYHLLGKGCDVNAQNYFGDSPLHMAACLSLSLWKMEVLLQHGAYVHVRNNEGDTAIDVALRCKRYWVKDSIFPMINLLLSWGSVVKRTNAMVVSHLAFDANCELKTLRRALEDTNGANSQDAEKLTPLHYAVRNNRIDLAQLLLEKGAKIDARDCRGQTPLHFGVSHDCSSEMVMFLLGMGSNVSVHSSTYAERNALTRRLKHVKEYFFDFENDTSTFLDAFTSKTNCRTHFHCFAELIKYLPAIDFANFYLAFSDSL